MLEEDRVVDKKAYCEKCCTDVAVSQKPGAQDTAQLPYVLVDDEGHLIAERTKEGRWEKAT